MWVKLIDHAVLSRRVRRSSIHDVPELMRGKESTRVRRLDVTDSLKRAPMNLAHRMRVRFSSDEVWTPLSRVAINYLARSNCRYQSANLCQLRSEPESSRPA